MKSSARPSVHPHRNPARFLSPATVALVVSLLVSQAGFSQQGDAPPAHWWPDTVEQTLSQAGTNRDQLAQALHDVPAPQRMGLQFLLENMPGRDAKSLSSAFLLDNVAQAYDAWAKAPWAKDLPVDIFLNDVLPYANIDEKREDWRKSLAEKCAPMIVGCKTPGEAAQRINEKLYGLVNVKYSTKRKKADQSPSESIESGLASCTGLTILLVDACRSVGVPARLTGIPNWIDNRGNHTWVEVWDQRWHFVGAAEPDPHGLDHAWFGPDAALAVKDSKQHAIYAVSFKKTTLPFPMVWAPDLDYVSAENVTDSYTQRAKLSGKIRLLVKVLDRPGGNRVAAQVHLSDPADAKISMSGTSKDERVDSNDMLTFEVPRDRTYNLQVELGQQKTTQTFRAQTNDPEVAVVYLTDTATLPFGELKPLKPKQEAQLKEAFAKFFTASPEKQAAWKFDGALEKLLAGHEAAVRKAAWEAYAAAPIHDAAKEDFAAHQVRFDKYLSPYVVRAVGKKPANGWPLFIAMHGGGNAPKSLNDSQWKEMQHHYHDQPSVTGYLYLALRAPNDSWNGFYDDYVYPLVDNLIREFVLYGEVDPDKVFIMGYSHGGYGAFAIGPKMPDHFAAIHASAGAPTDGETSAKTLRNTPFTFMIGENDHAYGRLDRDRAFNDILAKLRGNRTDIYPAIMEFKAGYNHPNLPDREKIKDMYPSVRDPVPTELTWEQTDGVIKNFYWLNVPKPAKKQEIDAACHDNHIVVTTTNIPSASVLLDNRLVDLKKPVTIEVNGHSTTHKLKPSLETLCQTLMERGDPELAFTTRVELAL